MLTVSKMIRFMRGGILGNGQALPVVLIDAKNTSGGALARGDVVVFDRTNSTVNLICVTTTTNQNSIDVVGMVYDAALGDAAVGRIQIYGPTKFLKVDGNTDIAVGDMLGTFTTAKIASITSTGGRFARAMEAYSTNDAAGVIDALILNLNMSAFSTE